MLNLFQDGFAAPAIWFLQGRRMLNRLRPLLPGQKKVDHWVVKKRHRLFSVIRFANLTLEPIAGDQAFAPILGDLSACASALP